MSTNAKKTGVRTVKRVASSATSIAARLRQHLVLRVQAEAISKQADAIKKALMVEIETKGYEDDAGHYWLELDEEVEVDGWGRCSRLQRQKRISQPMDEDVVEKICRDKGLWVLGDEGGILAEIIVVDEDALRKAYFEGKITKPEFEEMFPKKVTYAFVPEKAK